MDIALATCINYADLNSSILRTRRHVSAGFFTALHGMQTRSSDENSVCPSVCQTREL